MTDLNALKARAADYCEAIALHLLGEPNKALSSRAEWRWGAHGSLCLHLAGVYRGLWVDFADDKRLHSMIDLVENELSLSTGAAIRWLTEWFGGAALPVDEEARREKREQRIADFRENERARVAAAARIWRESDLPGRRVGDYLAGRNLVLPDDVASRAIRSSHCPWKEGDGQATIFAPCMVARYSPIENDLDPEALPSAVHRTRLDILAGAGRKKALGPTRGQVIKLSPDEDVCEGLGICEGIEDGLAILNSGWSPIWAMTGTAALANFPLLAGIEALTIFADRDEDGQRAALRCRERWGRRTTILLPPQGFKDWNAAWSALNERLGP